MRSTACTYRCMRLLARSPPADRAARGDSSADQQQAEEYPIAGDGVKRLSAGSGQAHIGETDRIEGGMRKDAALGVDDPGNAVIGDADQRQPFFDGSGAGHREMLIRAGAAPIPGVV